MGTLPLPPGSKGFNERDVRAWAQQLLSGVGLNFGIVSSDSGTANADTAGDTLGIIGDGDAISTSVSADNVTITFNANAPTEDTSPDLVADFVVTYDADAAATKKVSILNLIPGILQVQSAQKTDTYSHTGTTWTDITDLSVTITPKATSSTILLVAMITGSVDTGSRAFLRFERGGSAIGVGDSGTGTSCTSALEPGDTTEDINAVTMIYLDSPATTSATTYTVATSTEASKDVFINRSADVGASDTVLSISNLFAIELS